MQAQCDLVRREVHVEEWRKMMRKLREREWQLVSYRREGRKEMMGLFLVLVSDYLRFGESYSRSWWT